MDGKAIVCSRRVSIVWTLKIPFYKTHNACKRFLPMNVCLLRRTGFVISHITKSYIIRCTWELFVSEIVYSAYW